MNKKRYVKEIEQLFVEWKKESMHDEKTFVADGIINPDIFFEQDVRPLFLLKEAYAKDGIGWDLTQEHNNAYTDEKQKNTTWPNISRWTYGLFNTTQTSKPELSNDEIFEGKRNKYLQKIAAINVRKSSGVSVSSMKALRQYAESDKERLKKQIELTDPTVIICCYTLSLFKIIFDKKHNGFMKNKHYDYIELNNHKVLVLDFYHPSCRKAKETLFEMFVNLYNTALNEE